MLRTYEAILVGDRIEFPGAGPQEPGPLNVHVTVIGAAEPAGADGRAERGAAMAARWKSSRRLGPSLRSPIRWNGSGGSGATATCPAAGTRCRMRRPLLDGNIRLRPGR